MIGKACNFTTAFSLHNVFPATSKQKESSNFSPPESDTLSVTARARNLSEILSNLTTPAFDRHSDRVDHCITVPVGGGEP